MAVSYCLTSRGTAGIWLDLCKSV